MSKVKLDSSISINSGANPTKISVGNPFIFIFLAETIPSPSLSKILNIYLNFFYSN